MCWQEGITNNNAAYHWVYGETCSRYGLGAQLACCARANAVEAIKAVKAASKETDTTIGERGSILYDACTFRLMSLDLPSREGPHSGAALRQIAPRAEEPVLMEMIAEWMHNLGVQAGRVEGVFEAFSTTSIVKRRTSEENLG